MRIKHIAKKLIRKTGFDVVRYVPNKMPNNVRMWDLRTIEKARPFTMTSNVALVSLIDAVHYVDHTGIMGAVVECGVWKGGSMMAVADSMALPRTIYMYDTFNGMTDPGDIDKNCDGIHASKLYDGKYYRDWCNASLDEVKRNMRKCPRTKVVYVKGRVERTIPRKMPLRIAILRLDTDWYQSTKHELTHLFPQLAVGGVLIIDDYGYWRGARQAVDEYFVENNVKMLLHRVDDSVMVGIKI